MKIWRLAAGMSILTASSLATTVSGDEFSSSTLGIGLQQLILNTGTITITLNATDSGWWDVD